MLDKSDPSTIAEFEALSPLKRFPLLLDEGRPIAEGLHHPGPVRLIPDDPAAALEVRFITMAHSVTGAPTAAPLARTVSDREFWPRQRRRQEQLREGAKAMAEYETA
jgi:glutathione S-transferase